MFAPSATSLHPPLTSSRFFAGNLVLGGAGECAVNRNSPGALALGVGGTGVLLGIFADASALHVLEFHNEREFFLVDSVGIVNESGRIGKSNRFRTELDEFLHAVLGYVA